MKKNSKFKKQIKDQIQEALTDGGLVEVLSDELMKSVQWRLRLGVHTFGIDVHDVDGDGGSIIWESFLDLVEEAIESEIEDCVADDPKHYRQVSKKFKEWSARIDKELERT